jgi:UDP-N-acetylmuramate dehydrogenase
MVIERGDADTCSLGSFFTNPGFGPSELAVVQGRAIRISGDPAPTFAGPRDSDDVRVPAAWMIERAGFGKGYGGRHGIGISQKHVLALVNRGGGSTSEAVALAHKIAAQVWDSFGVALSPEPDFVGHSWASPVPTELP